MNVSAIVEVAKWEGRLRPPETIKELKEWLQPLGISANYTDAHGGGEREVRVNFYPGNEATAGYQDGLDEAFYAGIAMWRHRHHLNSDDVPEHLIQHNYQPGDEVFYSRFSKPGERIAATVISQHVNENNKTIVQVKLTKSGEAVWGFAKQIHREK